MDQPGLTFVGIDIAKSRFDACFLRHGAKPKRLALPANSQGHDKLLAALRQGRHPSAS